MRRVGKFIGCCLIAVSLRLYKPIVNLAELECEPVRILVEIIMV